MAALVELDRVWKRFRLGSRGGLLSWWKPRDELWALRDVSLRLEAGESVGLIGHNGAGKTTALKLLAGITRPTRGLARARGRVASLINLGAGFHPELTGRENVLLNGVILGLTRREVRARFDEIVAFAELEAYLDTPVKRYSSGMYARLGFAVAAHVDPDVLLVDEVLSVGDIAFQDRSLRKMLSIRDSGRGILFVSHNLSAVEMMCDRAIWLDHGQIRQAGPTAEVVQAYIESVDTALVADTAVDGSITNTDAPLVIEETSVLGADGHPTTDFGYGEPCTVRLRCAARMDLEELSCTLTVRGDYGPLFSAVSQLGRIRRGPLSVECRLRELPLLPGLYRIEADLRWRGSPTWAVPETVAAFRVTTDLAAFGSRSPVGATKSRGGFLLVPYAWRLETTDGVQQLAGLQRPDGAPIIAGGRG
jgi:homopolymeric O-antigen transport system ATP-binding protein